MLLRGARHERRGNPKQKKFCEGKLLELLKSGESQMSQDEKLICEECGCEFVFTAGEQEFYAEKGLGNKPKRCPECRKARKQQRKKRLYDAVCSKCGISTKVPFKPIEGKEVFCRDCFKKD